MAEYFELLKRPEWQKKRLEILQRDDFTCQECADPSKTLHVHHTYYEAGILPWDYPSSSLLTLCEDCHKMAQGLYRLAKRALGEVPISEIERLLGYAKGIAIRSNDDLLFGEPIRVPSFAYALGLAQSVGLKPDDIIGLVDGGHVSPFAVAQLSSARRESRKD